mgnify:FL=1
MSERILKLKNPELRSEYTHALLKSVEDSIDDFRDANGDNISYEELDNIIQKVSTTSDEVDGELLRELTFENFIDPQENEPLQDREELEYGASSGDFPDYNDVLTKISILGDEWWATYDRFVHDSIAELFSDVLDSSLSVAIGAALTKHEESFDEEGSLAPRVALYVLKTCVPCREDSNYQNSLFRIESEWCEHGILPGFDEENDMNLMGDPDLDEDMANMEDVDLNGQNVLTDN